MVSALCNALFNGDDDGGAEDEHSVDAFARVELLHGASTATTLQRGLDAVDEHAGAEDDKRPQSAGARVAASVPPEVVSACRQDVANDNPLLSCDAVALDGEALLNLEFQQGVGLSPGQLPSTTGSSSHDP
eukprot:11649866-Alexandrium_andersonii.AAC.1